MAASSTTRSSLACARDSDRIEYTDPRGFGKYTIEFVGPGNILLGRLWWSWRAKRFRDNRMEIMAVASERDRILGVVKNLLGG